MRRERSASTLSLAAGVLSLEISDNGRGLRGADLAKARSFGIRGLHERASTVGGWVDLSSAQGTTLILSVPLADAQRAIEAFEFGPGPARRTAGRLSKIPTIRPPGELL